MSFPIPHNEPERLMALYTYRLLDTEPELVYDQLTLMAAQLCNTPIAAISLIDANRQWFKARIGIEVSETLRENSYCTHTILQSKLLVIPDTTQDSRFCDRVASSGEPPLRFYAGAPLALANGVVLGTLCVADSQPRELSADQCRALEALAQQVVSHIEFRLTEIRLKDAQEVARMGSYEEDVLTGRRFWSEELFRLLDFDKEDGSPSQADFLARIHPDDLGKALGVFQGMVEGNDVFTMDLRFRHRNGSYHWMHCRGKSLKNNQGQTIKILGTTMDITERKEGEEALRRSEESLVMTRKRLNLALEHARLGTFHRDIRTGEYLEASLTWRSHCGLGESSPLKYVDILQNIHPADRDSVAALVSRGLTEHIGYETEFRCRRLDGSMRWIQVAVIPIHDAEGRVAYLSGVTQDITERKNALTEAQERADRDPLTGLLNHRAFHKRLLEEMEWAEARGTTLALVMLDMDNFKFFNDVYGHTSGDEVLCLIAQHLRQVCGVTDTLARFGGDEFALLLPNAQGERASVLEERLRSNLRELVFQPNGQAWTIPLTLSLGISLFPLQSHDRMELISLADARLRRAKAGGGRETDADRTRALMRSELEGFSMLDALVAAVDNKDRYTRRHSEDVMTYSLQIADWLGIDEHDRRLLAVAALLHDVGKIGIPDAILRKPGALSELEYKTVQQHPVMGAAIVGAVPGLEGTQDAILHHHECWDGSGYPGGLCGEKIPFTARLMAVADAFSAMTTDRPYRKALHREKALSILREGAAQQWDPEIVTAFLAVQESERLAYAA